MTKKGIDHYPISPDETPFNGRLLRWENIRSGSRYVLESIIDSSTFNFVMDAAAVDETIELVPGLEGLPIDERTKIKITIINKRTAEKIGDDIVLNRDNPSGYIPAGSTFEMDATESVGTVSYTRLMTGEAPRVREVQGEDGIVLLVPIE